MVAHAAALPGGIVADDLRGAVAVFVLVVGSALPAAIPAFLIGDPLVALRVSNGVLVALLFVVGFCWSRAIGGRGWGAGLLLMLSGVLLVGVAIAFGGSSDEGQRFGSVNPLLRSFFSSTGMPAAVLPLSQSAIAPSVVLSGMGRASPPALAV
jgi:hypothetical protein